MDKDFCKPAAYKSLNSSSVLCEQTKQEKDVEQKEESLYDQTESENIGTMVGACLIV